MIGNLEARPVAVTSDDEAAISTQWLVGADDFLAIEAQWRALYEASRTQNPFLCWEWISSWVKHFCGKRLRTSIVREGDRIIAIAPFHLNRYLVGPGLYAHALQLMGPKEVQHLFEIREPLVIPGWERQAFAAILEQTQSLDGWDWIELSAQGPGLSALHEVLAGEERGGYRLEVEPLIQIPVMSLESTWEEQRRKLKRNIKESIRHCYNALLRDGFEHSFVADGGRSDATEAARRLVNLHHSRSLVPIRKWHRDHFADTAIQDFEIDVLRAMNQAATARFAEVSIQNEVIASRACLESHGAVYLYYSGFNPQWWKYSVMTLLTTEVIRHAIACGLSTVNFSPGVDTSKSRWGVSLVPMQTVVTVRSDPGARIRHRLLRIRKRIRQPLHRQLDRLVKLLRVGQKPATGGE